MKNPITLTADVTGTVCKVAAAAGTPVSADDAVVVIESMKMEMPVAAPVDGTVVEVLVAEGDAVEEGQAVAVVQPAG